MISFVYAFYEMNGFKFTIFPHSVRKTHTNECSRSGSVA